MAFGKFMGFNPVNFLSRAKNLVFSVHDPNGLMYTGQKYIHIVPVYSTL